MFAYLKIIYLPLVACVCSSISLVVSVLISVTSTLVLGIHTRAGILVVEKDHGSGANDPNRLVRLLLGRAAIDHKKLQIGVSLVGGWHLLFCRVTICIDFAFEHGNASICPE